MGERMKLQKVQKMVLQQDDKMGLMMAWKREKKMDQEMEQQMDNKMELMMDLMMEHLMVHTMD